VTYILPSLHLPLSFSPSSPLSLSLSLSPCQRNQAIVAALHTLQNEARNSCLDVKAGHFENYRLHIEGDLARDQHQTAWPDMRIWDPFVCLPYDIVEMVDKKAAAAAAASEMRHDV
jgi:hypothetical protein